MPLLSLSVPSDEDGSVRVDKFIASASQSLNRSRLKAGLVKLEINGTPAKLSSKVHACDKIDIEWQETYVDDIEPQDLPLSVIYEDESVTVIDKQQGMVTHPAAGNWTGTLVNALLYRWGRQAITVSDMPSNGLSVCLRPGIVHRLDKDTSGVIIAARTRDAEGWLQEQFRTRRVKKEYIAIVRGRPPARSGTIKTNIIRDPRNRQRFKAVAEGSSGKFAYSLYRCIACYGPYSLMRVSIKTGRTHQIRVHMKYIGCPIAGDPLYGSRSEDIPGGAALMLHARLLAVRLPGGRTFSVFKAPVPKRFKHVLRYLHNTYEKCVLE